jgi:hypothetical protein
MCIYSYTYVYVSVCILYDDLFPLVNMIICIYMHLQLLNQYMQFTLKEIAANNISIRLHICYYSYSGGLRTLEHVDLQRIGAKICCI